MDEKHINANRPEPDQVKSAESVRRATMIDVVDVPAGLSSFGSDPAMYNVESVGNTINNSDGISSQNENAKNQNVVNLDENMTFAPEDQKHEMIIDLNYQINNLEKQVKERKKWAQQTALKFARKLCDDLSDLKMLRMEREETQRLKASGQFDSANADVRRLETENCKIKAEIEASKLNALESVTTRLEVSNEEKKLMKRLVIWEKQKSKMQEEIAAEKQKISEIQHQMVGMDASAKEMEAKWREEQKAKELAAAEVKEEKRLKEETEACIKRRQEALHLKIKIDIQRHKVDLQRLNQELSHLKASAELSQQSANPPVAESLEETIARLHAELNNLEKVIGNA